MSKFSASTRPGSTAAVPPHGPFAPTYADLLTPFAEITGFTASARTSYHPAFFGFQSACAAHSAPFRSSTPFTASPFTRNVTPPIRPAVFSPFARNRKISPVFTVTPSAGSFTSAVTPPPHTVGPPPATTLQEPLNDRFLPCPLRSFPSVNVQYPTRPLSFPVSSRSFHAAISAALRTTLHTRTSASSPMKLSLLYPHPRW